MAGIFLALKKCYSRLLQETRERQKVYDKNFQLFFFPRLVVARIQVLGTLDVHKAERLTGGLWPWRVAGIVRN